MILVCDVFIAFHVIILFLHFFSQFICTLRYAFEDDALVFILNIV